jgi:hypothetical protein
MPLVAKVKLSVQCITNLAHDDDDIAAFVQEYKEFEQQLKPETVYLGKYKMAPKKPPGAPPTKLGKRVRTLIQDGDKNRKQTSSMLMEATDLLGREVHR